MKLIVGNWKMNQTVADVTSFMEQLRSGARKQEAWIAPQALHVPLAISLAPAGVKIGAQNCSEKLSGALTGETSPAALKDIGAQFVLIGHSERRQLFQETSQGCALKIKTALSQGLVVIYCVGETLTERERGHTLEVVTEQLRRGLSDLGAFAPEQLIVAYEPVWAIGTGKVASPSQAQEVHAGIRKELSELLGTPGAQIKLLYGGSVKPDNVVELMQQHDIDGALVGGASLKASDFLALCQ